MSEKLFEIEEIKGHKVSHGKHFYLVRWKGYSSEDDTWEPRKNFSQATEILRIYDEKRKNTKAKKITQHPSTLDSDKKSKMGKDIKENSRKATKKIAKKINKKFIRNSNISQRNEKEIEKTPGDFATATPKKIINHILMNEKEKKPENLINKMYFQIEWENIVGSNKLMTPTFQSIQSVKENCPLLLCEYYEKYINF